MLGFVAVLDPEGTLLDVNEAALSVGGLARAAVVGEPFWACPWWSHAAAVAARIEGAVQRAAGGETVRFDVPVRTAGDGQIVVDFMLAPVRDERGAVLHLIPSGVDVTERRQAEEALEQLNETLEARVEERTRQVRELSRALTLAEQEERQCIAHVLHDDLQQLLVGAQMMATLGDAERLQAILGEAAEMARTLSHELSPPILKGADLEALLWWLAETSREQHGLEVEVELRGRVAVPDEALRILLYQLIRELLFNVVKHAGTGRARVVAEQANGRVRVTVEDGGAGFDPATLKEVRAPGVGLPSVRERVEMVGGACEVASAPGRGTRVAIALPVRVAVALE